MEGSPNFNWDSQVKYSGDEIWKLIQNKSLNVWTAIFVLHRESSEKGIWPLICNEIPHFSTEEIGFFIPQLCNRTLVDSKASPLVRVLLDRCSSLSIALSMYFWYQAALEDATLPKSRCNRLWHETEMAAVNSTSKFSLRVHRFEKEEREARNPQLKRLQRRTQSVPADLGIGLSINKRQLSSSLEDHKLLKNPNVLTIDANSTNSSVTNNENESTSSGDDGNQELTQSDEKEITEEGSLNNSTHSEPEDDRDGTLKKAQSEQFHFHDHDYDHESHDEYSTSPPGHKTTPTSPDLKSITFLDDSNFSKLEREHYFHTQIYFVNCLTTIASNLKPIKAKSLTKEELNNKLYDYIEKLQQNIITPSLVDMTFSLSSLEECCRQRTLLGIYLPLFFSGTKKVVYHRVVRLLANESHCLSSRDRVPYLLYLETICFEECEDKPNKHSLSRNRNPNSNSAESKLLLALEKIVSIKREMKEQLPLTTSEDNDWVMMDSKQNESTLSIAYPEPWEQKQKRIQKTSPFGIHPNWKLHSVIVKSGDDLRQEQLAVQLISIIYQIFKENDIPLWLYPYYVIATSSDTGLIETVPDAISLDSLKKRIPNITSLRDYFISAYGPPESIYFLNAQRNFVESLAGYSLVCYLLQIKDRHNGNILIHREGYIIHIDYGYMLTSSPGNITFENAPFKLTHQFIELMGGEQSDMFHYFKLLFIRGFLELRRHASKIITIVEMLFPGDKLGCFYRKDGVISEFKERFKLELSDDQCVTFCQDLIKESAGNWRTQGYDSFQYYTNGILS